MTRPRVPSRTRPRAVPAAAEERPRADERRAAEYWIDDRLLARVYWHETGAIEHEVYFDAAGRTHGTEREGFEDGRTKYRATWVHGVQHGWQRQWDERGTLLVETRYVRGTGLDLWFDGKQLVESREFVGGLRHGFERAWKDRHHVWSETRFETGVEHGIQREWNAAGRLRRGFPRYFVAGTQLDRRSYLRACESDPSLPRPGGADDRPRRAVIKIPR